MSVHPHAGRIAPAGNLLNVVQLECAYYQRRPDADNARQFVAFGTSGHRGTALDATFTEVHVIAITQAICDYRASHGITGPLYLGKDTHALSGVAQQTVLEVLTGNDVETFIQRDSGFTPTPVISRAIIVHNRGRKERLADGIILTPSHNPPEDGGLKYNPPNGGPAPADVTQWIQQRANELLQSGWTSVRRVPLALAMRAPTVHQVDLVQPYVDELSEALDLDAIRAADLSLAANPLGGASLPYWERINERYHLNIALVNSRIAPTFSFVPLDHDGRIRMDCSSPYAMAGMLKLRDRYDVAFGNDPDADRHGIVTRSGGLMNPNHFLAVAINYLLPNRPVWPKRAAIGKTVVSSGLIDRVVAQAGRQLTEMPVGFKWFSQGLFDASLCFAGEESAGASFLCKDGTVWTTDKDGILMALLAGEITARTGKDPGVHYRELTTALGTPYYTRLDAPATPEQKRRLQNLSPDAVRARDLAGEPIIARLTRAPASNEPIGGLKIVTRHGWFATRPSGTENLYKIYAESFTSEVHLKTIVAEARHIVADALASDVQADPRPGDTGRRSSGFNSQQLEKSVESQLGKAAA